MFILWNAAILGAVDVASVAAQGAEGVGVVFDPLEVLRAGGGGEELGVVISVFTFFAVVTSFIGFVVSFAHGYECLLE